MSKKKIFTEDQLKNLTPEEIIDKIQHEDYSLLRTIGGEKLRREMVPVGVACHTVLNHFFHAKNPGNKEEYLNNVRKRLVKTLQKVAPATYDKNSFSNSTANGHVIGFNHPSLGEILRFILMKIDLMGDKPMLFPVNLPWYESIAKEYDRLKEIGIIITPTITPSTWEKLSIKEGDKNYAEAEKLKKAFRNIYTNTSYEIVKNGGVIFVAPAATRQKTVFKSKAVHDKQEKIIPTLSILAINIYKDESVESSFIPLAVKPPKNYKRGLNLFKRYELIVGEEMGAKYIRDTYKKDGKRLENFDWDFHKRIADKLPKDFLY